MAGKVGRPTKINTINLEQLTKLATYGLTDPQIADIIGISLSALTVYKRNDASISAALKAGKAISDEKVERSLYERACGYSHPEDKVFCHEGQIVTHTVNKIYPPDPTSMIFWLKNRKPEQWRDTADVTATVDLTVNVKKTYKPIADKNLIEEVNG